MVDVKTSIKINAPLNEVVSYACNPGNAPQWYTNIKSVIWKTAKPLQVAFVAKFLGKELAYTYEVAQFLDHTFTMKTADGPFPMETTYTFNAKNTDITLMAIRNKGIPTGFSRLLQPFMRIMMKRANNKDLRMIKSILEKRH